MQIDIILDPEVKFYFVHIHKNAGTSVRRIFNENFGSYYRHVIKPNQLEDFLKTKRLSINTLDKNYILNKKIDDQMDNIDIDLKEKRGFTFIRHPYFRARSIYMHFMRKIYRNYNRDYHWIKKFLDHAPLFKKEKSFENFLLAYKKEYFDYHYIEQTDYLLQNVKTYKLDESNPSKIYEDFSNFVLDYNYHFSKKINKKFNSVKLSNKSYLKKYLYFAGLKTFEGFLFNQNRGVKNLDDLLNENTKKIIEKISEKDFQLFNFKKN